MQYPKPLGLLATTARDTLAKEIVIVNTRCARQNSQGQMQRKQRQEEKKGTFLMCTKKEKERKKGGEFHKLPMKLIKMDIFRAQCIAKIEDFLSAPLAFLAFKDVGCE